VTCPDLLSKYLLKMGLRFDAILYSSLGNKNYVAGHIKCSRGPQVPHPCLSDQQSGGPAFQRKTFALECESSHRFNSLHISRRKVASGAAITEQ